MSDRRPATLIAALDPGDAVAFFRGMAVILNPSLPPRAICLTTGKQSVLAVSIEGPK